MARRPLFFVLIVHALALALALALSGCRPDLGDRESLVTSTRVLAVRGEPPEARPEEEVTYDLLVASPSGTVSAPKAAWAFCAAAKPLADNNSVSKDCLGDAAVRPIKGNEATVTARTPKDACLLFGPEVPPGGFRPHDADVTGGYFQPVRVRVGDVTAFGMERVSCNLADAPVDAVKEYLARYKANRNPTIAALIATAGGSPADLAALRTGQAVTFTLSWKSDDAEVYPLFDRASQSVVDRREALRVSWFATAGQFEEERTGRAEDDEEISSSNVWTAPEEATTVFLWAVLRDSRGGAAFTGLSLEVRP